MMAKQALRVCGSGLLSPKGPPGPGWAKAPLGGCCTGGGGDGEAHLMIGSSDLFSTPEFLFLRLTGG